MLKWGLLLLLELLVLLSFNTQAKTQLKFINLSAQEGLLSPFVQSVVEDHHGFIWSGGHSGLQRFDGNEFENFLHV